MFQALRSGIEFECCRVIVRWLFFRIFILFSVEGWNSRSSIHFGLRVEGSCFKFVSSGSSRQCESSGISRLFKSSGKWFWVVE